MHIRKNLPAAQIDVGTFVYLAGNRVECESPQWMITILKPKKLGNIEIWEWVQPEVLPRIYLLLGRSTDTWREKFNRKKCSRHRKIIHHGLCIHSLHMGWRNFFPVVLLCQFLVLVGNRIWFYILTYLEYNTLVALC